MFLNDRQITVMVEQTARELMPFFDSLAPNDRLHITSEIAHAAVPIIMQMPPGASSASVEDYSILIREHAIAILIGKIRLNGGLEETEDDFIAQHIDQEVIVMFSQAVQQMVSVALDAIPPAETEAIEEIISNLDEIDLDLELKKLLEENK